MSEQREASEIKDPNAGLSVSGSQLLVLAYLDVLPSELPGDWGDKKADRAKRRLIGQTLPPIQTMVLEGDTRAAKLALSKVASHTPQLQVPIEEIAAVLGADTSVEEVLGAVHESSVGSFIRTLPGWPLVSVSPEADTLFLTKLGVEADVNSVKNRFTVRVWLEKHQDFFRVDLPLDQQRPFSVDAREIEGAIGNEALKSKAEVLEALRSRYQTFYTHVTGSHGLLRIISSGRGGTHFESGLVSSHVGLFVENYNPKSNFIKPNSCEPIVLISSEVGERKKLATIHGWPVIDGGVNTRDPDLVGIWVTPTLKRHLLHWVSTWGEEKRQQVFGRRQPENLFLSSAEDVAGL